MIPDIEQVKRLVVEAGRRALARCGTVTREHKADESLVTAVDRETEQFLHAELSALAPDYAFLGEEYGFQGPADAPFWACDPIDGTTNYVFGIPFWCVSVGLLADGVPEMGAIYLPRLDELFWAVRGRGAYCGGVRLQRRDQDSLHVEDTVCMTSNAAKSLGIEALPSRIRAFGSIAAELAYTARGNLCATIGLREGIVDIAAALCICTEAGCVFRCLSGGTVDIPALIQARHTRSHFVYAPPALASHLQSVLLPR